MARRIITTRRAWTSWFPIGRISCGECATCKSISPRGRVLDIGCGKGEFAILMQEAGFDVEAIDESQLAIGALGRLRPEVKWHCGNVLEHIDELRAASTW